MRMTKDSRENAIMARVVVETDVKGALVHLHDDLEASGEVFKLCIGSLIDTLAVSHHQLP